MRKLQVIHRHTCFYEYKTHGHPCALIASVHQTAKHSDICILTFAPKANWPNARSAKYNVLPQQATELHTYTNVGTHMYRDSSGP